APDRLAMADPDRASLSLWRDRFHKVEAAVSYPKDDSGFVGVALGVERYLSGNAVMILSRRDRPAKLFGFRRARPRYRSRQNFRAFVPKRRHIVRHFPVFGFEVLYKFLNLRGFVVSREVARKEAAIQRVPRDFEQRIPHPAIAAKQWHLDPKEPGLFGDQRNFRI